MSDHQILQSHQFPRPVLSGFEHFNRFWLQQHACFAVKIKPGEFYVTKNHEAITTLLGSCVAACIRDPVAKVGGMNHFILPATDNYRVAASSDSARYGAYAMEKLINEIIKYGGRKSRIEIKISGGGSMLGGASDIGEQNAKFVMQYLQDEGFAITSADIGGEHPRHVVYLPEEGRMLVKKLGIIHNRKLFEVERKLKQQLASSPVGGAVELF